MQLPSFLFGAAPAESLPGALQFLDFVLPVSAIGCYLAVEAPLEDAFDDTGWVADSDAVDPARYAFDNVIHRYV